MTNSSIPSVAGKKIPVSSPSTCPAGSYLYLELPLYEGVPIGVKERFDVARFISFLPRLDCFCIECKKESTFTGCQQPGEHHDSVALDDREFTPVFTCARNGNHIMAFWFRIKDKILIKVGQYPSRADISLGEILRYRKMLGDDAQEFAKAIGLAAHGIGIGSFVYLRRIIERLVDEAHIEASKETGWNEDEYLKSRVSEKIKMLKSRLPGFLSENAKIYGVLSKGIHDLKEQECLDAFSSLRLGIEVILDEKLAVQERQDKLNKAKDELERLEKKHSQVVGEKG